MLPACLETLAWCDEILLIDCASEQNYPSCRKYGARVIGFDHRPLLKFAKKVWRV